jgi:uncharacterized membrane protein (DUF106 family)
MLLVNRLLDSVFDLLMRPLERVDVVTGLAVVSVFTAIAILVVVRITSDQRAMAAVKRQIHADLFEIRLFNDDLRAILRAELQILRRNATYLRLSIAPMLWMLVPAALVIAQLQFFFGYSGVEIGEPMVITAQLKSGRQLAALEVPPAIRVETPAIWVPALNQIMWRIVPTAPGDYQLALRIADDTYDKSVHVSDGLTRRSPARLEPRLLTAIVYPSEAPLPDSAPISAIRIDYPKSDIQIFGRPVHWTVLYTVLTLAFAFLLRRPLRVEV